LLNGSKSISSSLEDHTQNQCCCGAHLVVNYQLAELVANDELAELMVNHQFEAVVNYRFNEVVSTHQLWPQQKNARIQVIKRDNYHAIEQK
jgi:ABC-type uncharacterized transport system ATPase component